MEILDTLKNFLESKEHYKSCLTSIIPFWTKIKLLEPKYLEVYHSSFKIDASFPQYWEKIIVWWEIWSTGRYRVDILTHDSRYNSKINSIPVDEFIKMVLAEKILFI